MGAVSQYLLAFTFLGLSLALMIFIQVYSKRINISYIIPLLVLGAVLYLAGVPLPWPDPLWNFENAKIITEVIVIVSLMTAGLKIGTHYDWQHWKNPLSLVVVTMPLYMIVIFLLAFYLLGLNGPVSLLLAAVLAPTDPVLASEIQLESTQSMKQKNTGLRYILTAEAGINDGVAFPFVFLAILWSKAGDFASIDFVEFGWYYLLFKIIGGCLIGAFVGWVFSKWIYAHAKKQRTLILKGFLALVLTFFSYGIAEIAHTYGFLSVFMTGVFLQYSKAKTNKNGSDDRNILVFVEETEKLLVTMWTIFFGGAILSGILNYTDWRGVMLSLLVVLVARPLLGYLAVWRMKASEKKKWAIGFYGIKGIGSFFYLSFALVEGSFENYNEIIGIVSYIVMFSILIHGFSSISVVKYFERNESGT
jgi:NhaP-type Na+/H+ or K+/H+ antiporter